MIKKFPIVFLLLITASVLSQQVYESPSNGFKITVPGGWEITKGSTPMVEMVARLSENTSINIVIKQSSAFEGLTIEQAADESFKNTLVDQYSKQFENFSLLESGMTDMNTYRAFYFKYSCNNPNGGTLIAKQYFIISSAKLYIVSSGSPEGDYPYNEPVFIEIINSFTLL
jgi:hypothetical protein